MKKLTGLAGKFEQHLLSVAARGKTKTSRKQVLKKIDKAKATYQIERKRQIDLQKKIEKLESELSVCKEKVRDSRSEMLKLKQVLSNMDLSDCNYVVLYDNGDCGYVVNGDEYSLDVDDEGELDMLLMKDYRRAKKQSEKNEEDSNMADDTVVDDTVVDDSEEEDLIFPNLRLLD